MVGSAAAELRKITNDFEVLVVNDGSRDGTRDTVSDERLRFQLSLRGFMNEIETARVKQIWGSTGGTWRNREWVRWLQHPKVQERINLLTTGDPGRDRYQYFVQRYLSAQRTGTARVKRALTLGCGHGELERGLTQYDLAEIHEGIDLAEGAVQEATRLAKARGFEHLRYRVADLNTIELPECTYDVVFGVSAIHHVARLEHLFREVLLSLKPGGYFMLDEFVGPSQFQWPQEQVAIMNELLNQLPVEFRYSISNPGVIKSGVWTPSREAMNEYDPSEAIRSGEIVRLLPWFFDIVEFRGYGGNLLQFLLDDIAGRFLLDDPRAMHYLQSFFDREDQLIASGKFSHDFATIIVRRKPTRVERIFGSSAAYAVTRTRAILREIRVIEKPKTLVR
jgi:SAM-dependent methyltransferase